MTITDGEFQADSVEAILDLMLADAKERLGEDLNDDERSIFHTFYLPVAERLAEVQEDVGLVLSSAQIDNATGTALDLLTALIGIRRDEAQKAQGSVTFSREVASASDYTIPSGTLVQTDSPTDPVRFETQETVILVAGDTSVSVAIEAREGGIRGNVGSNTITVMPSPPTGIESVTNPGETFDGTQEETDDELRIRAKDSMADGSSATAPSLIAAVKALAGVRAVSIFINDTATDNTGTGGLPDHSFELVIEGGNGQEIGQAIMDTKAAGDTSYGGAYGTIETVDTDLGNGQTISIDFGRPVAVQIYVDMTIDVTDEYQGDNEVIDRIVNYVGGVLSTGNTTTGELSVGDDVLFGQVEYAIRDAPGVYDVADLTVDTVTPPAATTNIAISNSEVSQTSAIAGDITITTQ